MKRIILLATVLCLISTGVPAAEDSEPEEYSIELGGRGYDSLKLVTEDTIRYYTVYVICSDREPLPVNTQSLVIELTGRAKEIMTLHGGDCELHFNYTKLPFSERDLGDGLLAGRNPAAHRGYSLAIKPSKTIKGDSGYVSLGCFDDFEHLIQITINMRVTDHTVDLAAEDANKIYDGIALSGHLWDYKQTSIARRRAAERDFWILYHERKKANRPD